MEGLLDKLDTNVESALQTLFPAGDAPKKDAQQRAQEFATQVCEVHQQLAELKNQADKHPETPISGGGSSPQLALEQEIAELKRDVQLKTDALDKYQKILREHIDNLRKIDKENQGLEQGQ